MPRREWKPRIVMVEDEPDLQAVVHVWLAPRYEHVPLGDGANLLERLAESEPSLVILDVKLPGADGFELCRCLRADPRFTQVPVLFLTASREGEDYLKNFAAGGTSYLVKPVSRKQLLSAIRELLPRPVPSESVGTVD